MACWRFLVEVGHSVRRAGPRMAAKARDTVTKPVLYSRP